MYSSFHNTKTWDLLLMAYTITNPGRCKNCNWILEQLEATSHFWDLSWDRVDQTVQLGGKDVCASHVAVRYFGGEENKLTVLLLSRVPYCSNPLSFHEKSSGHLDHFWSLASLISLSSFILPSTSAHILLPTYPEASISTKDVRQWFHTDRMRQCVSSITGHREQLEQVILLVRVC